MSNTKSAFPLNVGQLELGIDQRLERDRNYHLGGRSFYFFDFDDNVAYLDTKIVLFHRDTGVELPISSEQFAQEGKRIGKSGPYANYFVDLNDEKGSFRYFRDKKFSLIHRVLKRKQPFMEDLQEALSKPDHSWKAPAWQAFFYATYNKRPVSLITARGHNRSTLKEGIDALVSAGYLPHSPNYLSLFPVSHPEVRRELGDSELQLDIADLKRSAIRKSVEAAVERYGYSDHHRFGMSDDDPKNVELISEEMRELKQLYPEMRFFVFQTYRDYFEKREILASQTRNVSRDRISQLSLAL